MIKVLEILDVIDFNKIPLGPLFFFLYLIFTLIIELCGMLIKPPYIKVISTVLYVNVSHTIALPQFLLIFSWKNERTRACRFNQSLSIRWIMSGFSGLYMHQLRCLDAWLVGRRGTVVQWKRVRSCWQLDTQACNPRSESFSLISVSNILLEINAWTEQDCIVMECRLWLDVQTCCCASL